MFLSTRVLLVLKKSTLKSCQKPFIESPTQRPFLPSQKKIFRFHAACVHYASTLSAVNQFRQTVTESDMSKFSLPQRTFTPYTSSLFPNVSVWHMHPKFIHQVSHDEQLKTKSNIDVTQTKNPVECVDKKEDTEKKDIEKEEKSPGIMTRFKLAYKEYGKVLIAVHVVTSTVWFGSFYYLAVSGVDVIAMLESLGVSSSILEPINKHGVGELAVAYLLYKVATPARYMVTIGGTQLTVRYLRKLGYMKPVSKEDSIRNLVREGRCKVSTQMKDMRGDLKEKVEEYKDKVEEYKDEISKGRTKVSSQMKDMKGELKDKVEEYKDKVEEYKDELSKGRIVKRNKKC